MFEILLLLFTNPVALILASIIILLIKIKEYKKTTYYEATKHSYFSVHFNKGRYGEYLTYKHLCHMEKSGAKFLFNVYIPKGNGETTEIDVLMICTKGIFVFESKNYGGWIFGSENQMNWYQTLPAGRGRTHKEHFYNPVMQNRSHIKHLRLFLGEQIPMRSIIVFSDRCTLKNIQISNSDVCVINRYDLAHAVSTFFRNTEIDLINEAEISEIYNTLYPFTQVNESVKDHHIANIHSNLNGRSMQQTYSNTSPSVSKCPRCNGDLILKTAKRGANAGKQFYGCSNYPKCKYIQKLHYF